MLDRKKGRAGPGFSEKYGSEMLQSAKCNTFGRVESLGAVIKTQHEKTRVFLVKLFFSFDLENTSSEGDTSQGYR